MKMGLPSTAINGWQPLHRYFDGLLNFDNLETPFAEKT
jgi:hypothetical protein